MGPPLIIMGDDPTTTPATQPTFQWLDKYPRRLREVVRRFPSQSENIDQIRGPPFELKGVPRRKCVIYDPGAQVWK